MSPYYQDGAVTIYHGDCREISTPYVLAAEAVITDPPYGVSERTDRLTAERSRVAQSHNFPAIFGDDSPFDPSPWLNYPQVILWGANHYADRLPPSPSWLVWDKREGSSPNDNADCELAWTNLGGPARLIRHLWSGYCRASEIRQPRVHPTQKPLVVMAWAMQMTTGTVLDPFMGSGTTLRAAKDLGRRAIGIEIEERYCEIAAKRCAQEVLAL
jgi:site-specific DNA-methyltransferase (adenine-specific)